MDDPPAGNGSQRMRRSDGHPNRRATESTSDESLLYKRDVHYSIQFDAQGNLIDVSGPPLKPLPLPLYVYEKLFAGQDITIYTFDTGVNTQSKVHRFI